MKEMSGRSLLQKQLKHFYTSLIGQGMKKSECPKDWFEAFLMLEQLLEKKDMILFLAIKKWLCSLWLSIVWTVLEELIDRNPTYNKAREMLENM